MGISVIPDFMTLLDQDARMRLGMNGLGIPANDEK